MLGGFSVAIEEDAYRHYYTCYEVETSAGQLQYFLSLRSHLFHCSCRDLHWACTPRKVFGADGRAVTRWTVLNEHDWHCSLLPSRDSIGNADLVK